MTVGQLSLKQPSLAALVAAIKARISRVALHRRFSESASAFLLHCLQFVLRQKFSVSPAINIRLLRRFRRVLIADSSSWDVNERLHKALPGSGGSASEANCKLQAIYDYKHGELDFLDVTAGTLPDNRYTDQLPDQLERNDLLLIDQGYFKLKTFLAIIKKGAFFLTRFLVRTQLRDALTQEVISLVKQLKKTKGLVWEKQVLMGVLKKTQVPCRLIALRVSEPVANERRRRLKKEARKKGRAVSQEQLILCAWTLLITNVPSCQLPLEMVRALYTLRWQIELLFKQLKSTLAVHQSNTSNEHRLRCELYGKLIVAVVIHRIHGTANAQFWNSLRREVSMEKLYKRIQERAFTLLQVLLSSVDQAVSYLRKTLNDLLPFCLKGQQHSRKTTLEILEAQCDPLLSFTCEHRGLG